MPKPKITLPYTKEVATCEAIIGLQLSVDLGQLSAARRGLRLLQRLNGEVSPKLVAYIDDLAAQKRNGK